MTHGCLASEYDIASSLPLTTCDLQELSKEKQRGHLCGNNHLRGHLTGGPPTKAPALVGSEAQGKPENAPSSAPATEGTFGNQYCKQHHRWYQCGTDSRIPSLFRPLHFTEKETGPDRENGFKLEAQPAGSEDSARPRLSHGGPGVQWGLLRPHLKTELCGCPLTAKEQNQGIKQEAGGTFPSVLRPQKRNMQLSLN